MSELCTDNRFELIEKYKQELIDATNIETAQDEMAVLDDILFRFWQMGWLDKLDADAMPVKHGKWVLDDNPHDGDCRCSVCRIAIDQMHERHHGLLNALTGGKWWTFYNYCPNCGAKMDV